MWASLKCPLNCTPGPSRAEEIWPVDGREGDAQNCQNDLSSSFVVVVRVVSGGMVEKIDDFRLINLVSRG